MSQARRNRREQGREIQKHPPVMRDVTQHQITINLSDLKTPEHTFTAEFCQVSETPNGAFLFSFSDYNPATKLPNRTLNIRVSDIYFALFWANSIDYFNRLEANVAEIYNDSIPMIEPLLSQDREATHTIGASLINIVQFSSTIFINFWETVPISQKTDIKGIVSIHTNVPVLLNILKQIKPLVEGLKAKLVKFPEYG